ncbi:PrsA superfamily peptidylprolyl isomerase [Candidatus Megaera venefica]|jgi:parvulin-like peptidyl-prolyl isomerase|uniref:Parvulin-like PPIase n=1 Tax=Candidatus Megaera venefica TaxID=2055910 RepID=A0ABU5NDH0_9RICK|nr:peptidylprolyl isomerase [Candidatus Megaera venefica]MEA0971233.1 PrsA superfamily peptidylprolyl isomerase [Candidatus Megaera venefica]
MKKVAIALLSVTLISSSACAENKDAENKNIVATYSEGEVTSEQVMEQFKPMLDMQPENKDKKFSELDKNVQEMLVKGFINQKLFEKEAEKLGIRSSEDFKKKIKAAESQLLQQELIERQLKTAVTDKLIDEEYNKLAKELKGQKEIKVAHILVDTEEKAKEIKKKLNKGSKFEDLVKEFSKDEGSKANGGELGYVMKGQLVPEFENKAFSMKQDEISDPVKTQFGWHIIKALDSRDVKIPPKEQALNGIKGKLSRDTIEKYITELSAKAKIELKL